jgi:hypothetical protein
MFNLKNAYKLITKEDILSIHKILGIFSLIHYLYRFGLLIIYQDTFLNKDIYALYYILLHSLLSITSLIFHIPKNRIKGKPMIYPEFRLHSIVFALRSSICTLIFYYNLPLYYNIITCYITIILADTITNNCKSTTKTMRNMPYNKTINDNDIKKINRTYSEMQILATLYMLGNINTAFTPMFAIQIAAFLMTLVRKNIIGSNEWHLFYMISLLINIFSFVTLDIIKIPLIYILGEIFIILRFNNNINKYLSWFVCFSIFYYLGKDDYSIFNNEYKYLFNYCILIYYFIKSKNNIIYFIN